MLKKLFITLSLSSVAFLSACGGGSDSSSTTVAYSGVYKGVTTGINVGPITMNVASDNTLTGVWTITNRVPSRIDATFKGSVNPSNGSVKATGYISVHALSTFEGTINATTGALSGKWYEINEPHKGGTFTAQR